MDTDFFPAAEMKVIFPGTTDQSWAQKRWNGTGPQYVKIGRRVYYRRSDVTDWVNGNMFKRTDRPIRGDVG